MLHFGRLVKKLNLSMDKRKTTVEGWRIAELLSQLERKILAVKISEGTVRFTRIAEEGVDYQKGKEIGQRRKRRPPGTNHTTRELTTMRRLFNMPSLALISFSRIS